MQDQLQDAPVAVSATCKCPGCGEPFQAGGRGLGKRFCSDKCRKCFLNAQVSNGAPLAPFILAWHATRHAKPGTAEAEVCTFARGQITEMARIFLEREEEAGRDPVAYVQHLMTSGTLYIDRTRK